MNVCGIDVSTYHLDFVFLHEEGPPEWQRITLIGDDSWERCRSVRVPSAWFEDTEAVGMEVAHGPSSGQINRVVGAVLSRLPRELLVEQWPVNVWKKAVGLPGNCSKYAVREYVAFGPITGHSLHRLERLIDWPQDACDAYCIALATKQALKREAA
jgi:hypothetical protein